MTPLEQIIADGVQTKLWENGDTAMGALCLEHRHRNIKPKDCKACVGIAAAEAIRDAINNGQLTTSDLFPTSPHQHIEECYGPEGCIGQ